MSVDAKVLLMKDLERSLSSVLTADAMGKALTVTADLLERYSIESVDVDNRPDDLLDAFVSAMSIQGRSQKTITRYTYIIQRMMNAVGCSTRGITVYHLRRYLADEKARGVADSTLDGVRQIFSAYFNWLQKENLIQTNPTANLGTIRCQKKVKQIYSDVDIERLKFAAENVRDRAIITFLASTGCRISEMTQLNRNDVDLDHLECKVLGKGNKERVVYLDPVAGMMIRTYLSEREDSSDALFVGRRGERLQPGGVRAMLVRLADAANVEHVHPHKFRRTLATNLIRRGMPIQEVACILGHDKLDTTMGYVVLDKSEVKNAYRKYAS